MVFVCGKLKVDMCKAGACDFPAENLCDYPIGGGKTCDLPICDSHSYQPDHEKDRHFCPVHQITFLNQTPQNIRKINPWPPLGYQKKKP
jgi:hypothetical protein